MSWLAFGWKAEYKGRPPHGETTHLLQHLGSGDQPSGRAAEIISEFNASQTQVETVMSRLLSEIPKVGTDRLSESEFHQLVACAADALFRYFRVAHIVRRGKRASEGLATESLEEFLSMTTTDFSVAIGKSIEKHDPAELLKAMDKYAIARK